MVGEWTDMVCIHRLMAGYFVADKSTVLLHRLFYSFTLLHAVTIEHLTDMAGHLPIVLFHFAFCGSVCVTNRFRQS